MIEKLNMDTKKFSKIEKSLYYKIEEVIDYIQNIKNFNEMLDKVLKSKDESLNFTDLPAKHEQQEKGMKLIGCGKCYYGGFEGHNICDDCFNGDKFVEKEKVDWKSKLKEFKNYYDKIYKKRKEKYINVLFSHFSRLYLLASQATDQLIKENEEKNRIIKIKDDLLNVTCKTIDKQQKPIDEDVIKWLKDTWNNYDYDGKIKQKLLKYFEEIK